MKSASLLERLLVDRRGLRSGSWGASLTATAIVAAATALRLILEPWLEGAQFITFFAAVFLATFLCGRGAGFLAVALSALSAWAFIMAPAFAFEHIYALMLFCVLAALDVVIISALVAALARVGHLNASLRDSEMRYRTLADNASDLITLRDIDRHPQYISPACRRLLGYEPEEFGALEPEDLVHPDDLETLLHIHRTLSAEVPTAKSIQRVRHKNGSYVWHEAVHNWVAAGTDGHPQILTVVRDITERKAAEDATARLQVLLNDAVSAIDDGIAIYDSQERLIVANAAMRRLAAGPPDLLEPGRTFTEVVDHVRTGYSRMDEKTFAAFRSWRTAQFRAADGIPHEQFLFDGNWILLKDFRTREGGVVSVASDITALKWAAIELDSARAKAEAANIAKSRFLAAASHDLRQPLQTIALLEGILREMVIDPKASSIVDKLGMSLNAMSDMLDALLEINQLEAGIVEPVIQDFAIGDLLERLRAELSYHAEAKGLALHVVRNRAIVRSDPKLLERIVRNLLSNAIKYTQKGKILIGCRRHGAALCIEVMDTGIGIPDDQIQLIFEEFHQVDNPARDRRHGLGLGLSIVQRLSNLLGHQIRVRSVLRKGSVFSVEVPIGDRPAAVPTNVRKPDPCVKPTQILLVEDDEAIRESTQILLERDGHTVVAAEDPAQALVHLRQTNWRPEVVVSDFNLPGGMNGLEMIEVIRSEFREPLSAILLTGGVSSAMQETLDAADCMLLYKPVPSATLKAAIAQCRAVPPKVLVET
jgi:PAS domain S-box-containing protein